MAEHALRIKMIVDAIQMQGIQPPAELVQAAQVAGQQANGVHEGRPPSGLEPPRVNSKDSGARSTISQSGS